MNIFGLIVLIIFTAILVLNMLFQRKQNVPENAFNADESIHSIPLLNYLAVFAAGMSIIGLIFPVIQMPVIVQVLGMIIALFGMGFFVLAFSKMYYNWWLSKKKGEVKIFMTDGVYAISRTPEVAGLILCFTGYAIGFFGPTTASALLIVCVLSAYRIKEKENFLTEHYVKAYGGYKKRVMLLWGKRKYPLSSALKKAEGQN